MVRLLVHVEGQTEEQFVHELLRPHLVAKGYASVSARLLGNARLRLNRGGIRSWQSVRREIIRHLSEDAGCIATTMVDYYALPQGGGDGWPGRAAAASMPTPKNAEFLESAIMHDLERAAPFSVRERFLPFVMMHEFEALLFSDCIALGRSIGRQEVIEPLQAVRDQFATPEDINDSPVTAPSKRVVGIIPDYEKPLFGTLVALEIGLAAIRRECPHFNGWLARLEALARL